MSLLIGICVGIAAGFLALVGGVFGSFVLGLVGIGASGIVGRILVATFGSVLLIWMVRWVRSNKSY